MATATRQRTKKLDEAGRAHARSEFLRIVEERLRSRLEKGDAYTSTADLYRGYEGLHAQGFSDAVTPGQSVLSVLGRAKYRDRVFYARNVTTQRAERSGAGRYAPYRIYLRADATPPVGFVLVPMGAAKGDIPAYISQARGVADAGVRVQQTRAVPEAIAPETVPETPVGAPVVDGSVNYEALAASLTSVVRAQAEVIDTMLPVLALARGKTPQ